MWIVQLALRRPYTFIVAALLILLSTPFVLRSTPVDVFPDVDIPVVSIVMSYNGLSAREMSDRIILPIERGLTNAVSDIEHVESQTLSGLGVIKVFFQPNVDSADAMAQLVSATQSSLRSLPPGTTPPTILKYSASNLPILQLGLSSPTLTEQELNDQVFNTLRPKIITVPGTAVTAPYGGKFRQVSVDLDGPALIARGLTPVDVVNALGVQNLALPTGTAKIGDSEINIALNGSPRTLAQLADIPVKNVGGTTIYLRDVANVRDGFQPQLTLVRNDGNRGLLMTVLKNGGASTLQIIRDIEALLPEAAKLLPEDIVITPLLDQSVFVEAAVSGVLHEALIAATLTATLILLFLGNWRSTAIVAASIPLSILVSLIALHLCGQTINIMTLGGLALAVGILVDDATVTIENIERHLHLGKDPRNAILDGAAEIAVPTFVATSCICIVFLPMFLLDGVARFLFVPLALAVVFAMAASWVLSRTLVPTLVMYLTRSQAHGHEDRAPGPLRRIHLAFNARFEQLRVGYTLTLESLLARKGRVALVLLGFWSASLGLYAFVGQDFFPSVDAGQMRLHVRAPAGTRLEEMPRIVDRVEADIRRVIPADQLGTVLDIIGGPYTPINTLFNNNGTIDSADAEILVSLKPGHAPTAGFIRTLRGELPKSSPGVEFYFQSADMVSQTLNFGLAAPIDIQFTGNKVEENLALATELVNRIRQVPGAVDAYIYQRFNKPAIELEMDRDRLQQLGLTARDVAQNVLVSLSSSFQTAPTYWLNPQNNTVYNVAVQTRQHEIDSLEAVGNIPVGTLGAGGAGQTPQLLGSLVQAKPAKQQAVVSRHNFQQVIDVYVSIDGRDLGSTFAEIEPLIEAARAKLARGSELQVRGQIRTMESAYRSLALGLGVAIVLVYLLIVVNFQSWTDAAIIITALPAALAGIAWMLFLTGTPLSVPALTGAIMTVGVATANSILVVSYARARHADGLLPWQAALEAGSTRLRPVLMTALAMIIGMVPMALGWGEGSEQNAPLGRAVIGGLLFATASTLLFVPLVYAAVHGLRRRRETSTDTEHLPASAAT
jgi:multidrug efflux pump subunit AcrB